MYNSEMRKSRYFLHCFHCLGLSHAPDSCSFERQKFRCKLLVKIYPIVLHLHHTSITFFIRNQHFCHHNQYSFRYELIEPLFFLCLYIICPHFTLLYNSCHCFFIPFRRIIIFLKQPFNHTSHPCAFYVTLEHLFL